MHPTAGSIIAATSRQAHHATTRREAVSRRMPPGCCSPCALHSTNSPPLHSLPVPPADRTVGLHRGAVGERQRDGRLARSYCWGYFCYTATNCFAGHHCARTLFTLSLRPLLQPPSSKEPMPLLRLGRWSCFSWLCSRRPDDISRHISVSASQPEPVRAATRKAGPVVGRSGFSRCHHGDFLEIQRVRTALPRNRRATKLIFRAVTSRYEAWRPATAGHDALRAGYTL